MIDSKIIIKKSKFKVKGWKLKIIQRFRDLKEFIMTRDVDFIFLFLASFLLTDYVWWERVLFSVGLIYIYKMIFKDIRVVKRINK